MTSYSYLILVLCLQSLVQGSPVSSNEALGLAVALRDLAQTSDLLLTIENDQVQACANRKRVQIIEFIRSFMDEEDKCEDRECISIVLRQATVIADNFSSELTQCLNPTPEIIY